MVPISSAERNLPARGAAFLAGTFLVCQLASLTALSGLLPILIAAIVLLVWRGQTIWAFFVAGIVWAGSFGAHALARGLDPSLNGRQWLVTGEVASVPEIDAEHASFDLELIDAPPAIGRLGRLRLAWYESGLAVRAGERWRVMVRLRHVHGLRNPGDYDHEGRLFDEGVGATGYVVRCPCNARIEAAGWRAPILRSRAWIAARIEAALPGSRFVGILQDLSVGLDARVAPEQWRVFAATGTTHLMAISGFHVAGVALLAMGLVGVLWRVAAIRSLARSDAQCVAGLAAATGYALLAGFSVPTQRTLVTLACVFAARLLRRATAVWSLLGLALIAVLLLDPLSSLGAGFWLSFATVAGILFALEGRLERRGEWRELVPTQIAATLCLLPLTLALFGTASLIGPLINLVAIPLFSLLLVPAVLAGVALLALPGGVGDLWFRGIEHTIAFVWPSFAALANSPLALLHVAARPPWTLVLLGAGMLMLLTPWPRGVRLCALACALPALFWRVPPLAPGAFDVTILDVGQGLAAYVATREHGLLFDTGPIARSGRAAAEFSVLPYLRAQGRNDLDLLVLSHGDRDHTGGVQAVLGAINVRRQLSGGRLRGTRSEPCVAGDTWSWDGVQFAFFNPPPILEGKSDDSENDASCVLAVHGPGGSVLLTGDIEAAAERAVLARVAIRRIDVVVVPHHGSRSSSSVEFVAALAPRWAVVPAGYDNRWGFPKPEVVDRWRAAGAKVLTTAHSGAITFHFARTGLGGSPQEYRLQVRRFWHSD
jgi:competence protein ComEC